MVFKAKILFLVAFVCCNSLASLTISIDNGDRTWFTVGERAFVSVYIEETGALLDSSSTYSSTYKWGTKPYVLKNESGNALWLESVGRPEFDSNLNTDDDSAHWQNNQIFWLELSGIASTPGDFTGTLSVTDTITGESDTLNYSFVVYPANGEAAIISRDAAASYTRQIEFRSYIRNNGSDTITLNSPYMDYYMTKNDKRQMLLNVWKKPKNACLQILNCGDNHYVFRQKYTNDRVIAPSASDSDGEFQLGYSEVLGDNPSLFLTLQEKDLKSFRTVGFDSSLNPPNQYLDESYAGYSTNYAARAMHRNEFYNPKMALYEKSGELKYGESPSWYSESSCTEVFPVVSDTFNVAIVRTYDSTNFCTAEDLSNGPTITFSGDKDVIYEGEDYFAKPIVSSDYGEIISLEIVSMDHYDWLEVGTPADYWDNYTIDVDTLNLKAYKKLFYVRSINGYIRQKNNLEPGVYTYVLKATDATGRSSLATRTIEIRDGLTYASDMDLDSSFAANNGVAILMGDETWFKKYQLDVASGIENFSNSGTLSLPNFYYDYYGQFDKYTIDNSNNLPHPWYTNDNMTQTYYDCGNNRFKVRYKYNKDDFSIDYNQSYGDNKTGFVYSTAVVMHKYDDWSLQGFSENEPNRRRQYNPYMPLYDGNTGKRLWGKVPSWDNQCKVYEESSSSESSSSSFTALSSESHFENLSVRFVDNNLESNNSVYAYMDVYNSGTRVVSLNNYEVRFYFNDTDSISGNLMEFSNDSAENFIQDGFPKIEKCGPAKFTLRTKFNLDASVNPNSGSNAIKGQLHVKNSWTNFDKAQYYSWSSVTELTKNNKIVLLDSNGNVVWGLPPWDCDGYQDKELQLVMSTYSKNCDSTSCDSTSYDSKAKVFVKIENLGDSSLSKMTYVDYYVSHPSGQVPLLLFNNEKDTLSIAGSMRSFEDGIYVIRFSFGNKHVYRFIFENGIPEHYEKELSFFLMDGCFCAESSCNLQNSYYEWNLRDDWSAKVGIGSDSYVKTKNIVVVYDGQVIYGVPDPSAPILVAKIDSVANEVAPKHTQAVIGEIKSNRIDDVMYAGGQLLSGGDFEDAYFRGWEVSADSAYSIRGVCPQGARFAGLKNGRLIQTLNLGALDVLADSGAVLSLWHRGDAAQVMLSENTINLPSSSQWKLYSKKIEKDSFSSIGDYSLIIETTGKIYIDDAALVPGGKNYPKTYETFFTNAAGEEIENRHYDGDKELFVTASERDAMGREYIKYLPFSISCTGVSECNSDLKNQHNLSAAKYYYTIANPNYPDAGGIPYSETRWKPDPVSTKDAIGAPGAAFGLNQAHVVRAFSSGVNLSGINIMDSASLNSAIAAVRGVRVYDETLNYHAAKDTNPTHLWELNVDQDGRKTFAVKDGNGHAVVHGTLDSTGNLKTRSVSEFDIWGNEIKTHPPMSCEYTNASTSCVHPSLFEYDAQGHILKSWEPDAGMSLAYYDAAGRLRATQTQRQLDSGKYSVIAYDQHNRPVLTGEWNSLLDSGLARAYFYNVRNDHSPVESDLIPGTITRTFYDRIPSRDTLDVELYPAGISVPSYTRGHTAAVISDVSADESGNVIRVSIAFSYDKYGRVVASYAYDPTVPEDSLKMLVNESEYDLGGKLVKTTKYPYGISDGGIARKISERYVYDRLGRIDSIISKQGNVEQLLARYEYYPSGAVKKIIMGNSITLSYTYHISGAMASAIATSSDGTTLYSDTLYYEDCGSDGCTPQYNGNISRMAHYLAHKNPDYGQYRDVTYTYDILNRLVNADDHAQDQFDEIFHYDAQGRIVAQRRYNRADSSNGGEYSYYGGTNKLKSVADSMGGSTSNRIMSANDNFAYDRDGNLVEDKSKQMKIAYDWRGMPVEFVRKTDSGDSLKLVMKYDGSGRRISKTRWSKANGAQDWEKELVTHYTGIGTEVRENLTGASSETKVVVNMPQNLGRYGVEHADAPAAATTYAWFLHDHLGSTVAVYGSSENGEGQLDPEHAYEYRSFGEQVDLESSGEKVTENFTGKEKDDEIELNYFGARYLDPMLGMWISVDPKRQFASPYLYAGNGYNPVNGVDLDGNVLGAGNQEMVGLINEKTYHQFRYENGLVQECLVCRDNPSGSLNYSQRISSAIRSENFGEIINEGLSSRERFYANKNGGAVTSIERGHPTAVITNGNAQDALHELSSHVIPAMLGDRPGNGSAVNEELMNSPGYLYLSPLDIPDHPIDQIHYDIVE